jgi:hypothetical protein
MGKMFSESSVRYEQSFASRIFALIRRSIEAFGELVVSGPVGKEILRGYANYLTFRMTLDQIAQGEASNVDFASWAKRVIADDKPELATVRTRKRRPTPEPV